jgi:hypothetical protein
MSRSLTTHIVIRIVMGFFLGVAILAGFSGFFIVAIPAFLISILLNVFLIAERKPLKVTDIKSAKKALRAGSYVVTEGGIDGMRNHLVQHPYDHKVALIYARTLSKYDLCDEGKRAYQLAAEGALKDDMQRAVDIFREYLAKYLKPFDHELTFQLSLLTEQYGDAHFATQGLESVIIAEDVVQEMLAKSLKENIRICKDLGFHDIAIMQEGQLESLSVNKDGVI